MRLHELAPVGGVVGGTGSGCGAVGEQSVPVPFVPAPQLRQTAFYARQLVSGLAGLAVPFLEARGASRGNVVRFPVKRRVFPQLALRASRQWRWGGRIDNGDASSGAERIRPDFTACWLVR